MRERPIFVPIEDDVLAAVVTMPDEDPEALVLLATGVGASRSHHRRLWTALARRLAERGVASVRFDYRGVGDSTGTMLDRGGPLDRASLVDQARAVLEAAMRGTGALRFLAVGNCVGGQALLELAGLPASAEAPCAGCAYILPTALTSPLRHILRRSKVGGLVASMRSRQSERVMRRFGPPFDRRLLRSLPAALASGPVLILFGGLDRGLTDRATRRLARAVDRLPPEHRDRFELRVLDGTALEGFLSLEARERTLREVERFIVSSLVDPDDLGAPSLGEAR